jgi:DNA-binding SARP family transcriptional activator
VSALIELACLYLDFNQLEKCLAICQLTFTQDLYNEVVHRVEMRAYAALGDRAAIVRRHQAFKAALKNDLGISPSQETEDLYRDLIAR